MAQVLKLVVNNQNQPLPAYRAILLAAKELLNIEGFCREHAEQLCIDRINSWVQARMLSEDEAEALLDFLNIDWSFE